MEKAKRIKQIQRLRNKGLSYGNIATVLGISRQRVHQIVSGYDRLLVGHNSYGWYVKLKGFVFERDDYKCQKCQTKERLVIHHLDGDDRNNNLSNLITLCPACHGGLHALKNGGRECIVCGKFFKSGNNQYAYRMGYCDNCWSDRVIRKHNERHFAYKCEICGKDFDVPRSQVKYRKKIGRNVPRFCSKQCYGVWLGTNYGRGRSKNRI